MTPGQQLGPQLSPTAAHPPAHAPPVPACGPRTAASRTAGGTAAVGTKSVWQLRPARGRPRAGRGEDRPGWAPRPVSPSASPPRHPCWPGARPAVQADLGPPRPRASSSPGSLPSPKSSRVSWPPSFRPPAPGPAWASRASASHPRLSRKLCSGKLGAAMKLLGRVAPFWAVFILGHVTGCFVHKCK